MNQYPLPPNSDQYVPGEDEGLEFESNFSRDPDQYTHQELEKLRQIWSEPIIVISEKDGAGLDKALSNHDWEKFWNWEDPPMQPMDEFLAQARVIAHTRGLLDD